ncbi:MAG TPA: c-type cytochrome [Bryobacteraceae bacterium]|nr:c-type cytochrome [Bryobacteraceae bacterium]
MMINKWIVSGGCLCALMASQYMFGDDKAGDAAKGKELFEQCAVCHNVDTDEKKMGPSLKGLFKRDKLKNGKKVTEENVKAQINAGGNGMPAYEDMLSDQEKNDIIAYLKTL